MMILQFINSPGGVITSGWQFMTRCSMLNPKYVRFAWDLQPVLVLLFLCAGTKKVCVNAGNTRAFLFISRSFLAIFLDRRSDINIQAEEMFKSS